MNNFKWKLNKIEIEILEMLTFKLVSNRGINKINKCVLMINYETYWFKCKL